MPEPTTRSQGASPAITAGAPAPADAAAAQPSTGQGAEGSKSEVKTPAPNEAQAKEATTAQQTAHLTDTHAESISIINELKNINEVKNIYFGDQVTVVKTFSLERSRPIPMDAERRNAARFYRGEAEVDTLLHALAATRVLVLTGDAQTGKAATAGYLVHRMRAIDPRLTKEALQVAPLAPQIHVDIEKDVLTRHEPDGGALIFKDALSRGNEGIREFLAAIDQGMLESLTAKLRAKHTYIIFTSERRAIEKEARGLLDLGICSHLAPLSHVELLACLKAGMAAAWPDTALSDDVCQLIVEEAKTPGQILRFARRHGATIRTDADVRVAFEQLNDVASWFYGDLAESLEAWIFTFSLTVAQCTAIGEGVRWLDFRLLARTLRGIVRRSTGASHESGSFRKERLSEDWLLERAEAGFERDAATGQDLLRFNDSKRAGTIWHALLQHSRGLLTDILPALISLVEGDSPSVRRIAAQAIGRLGECDAGGITFPLLAAWSMSDNRVLRGATGPLLLGAMASRDPSYRGLCVAELKRMSLSEEQTLRWASIAAYREIGVDNLALSMSQLRVVAEAHASQTLLDVQRIERLVARIEAKQNLHPVLDADRITLDIACAFLRDLGLRILGDHAPEIYGIQFALTSLSAAVGPMAVLTELRKWFRGSDSLRALVALMYLQEGGLADLLSRPASGEKSSATPNDAAEDPQPSVILAAIQRDYEAPRQVAAFLEEVFDGFYYYFAAGSAPYLRRAYSEHLRQWMALAARLPSHRQDMEGLLIALLSSGNEDLFRLCYDLLSSDETLRVEGSDLNEFAKRVLVQALKYTRRAHSARDPATVS